MSDNIICRNCGTVNAPKSKECENCHAPIKSHHREMNHKNPKFWIFLFVACFLAYVIGSYGWDLFKEHKGVQEPVTKVVPVDSLKDWHKQMFASGCTLELPVHLTETDGLANGELKSLLSSVHAYQYAKKNLAISFSILEYKSTVDSLSVTSAMAGANQEVASLLHKPLEVVAQKTYSKDGVAYAMQTVNYIDKNNEAYEYKQLIAAKGIEMWNLSVSYERGNQKLSEVAERIIQSFSLGVN